MPTPARPRTCSWCGDPLTRRINETPGKFTARRHCSRSCAVRTQNSERAAENRRARSEPRYDTSPVPGDLPVEARLLEPGMRLRLFSGIEDTATVVSVESTPSQYLRAVRVTLDSGTVLSVGESRELYVASGPARPNLNQG